MITFSLALGHLYSFAGKYRIVNLSKKEVSLLLLHAFCTKA